MHKYENPKGMEAVLKEIKRVLSSGRNHKQKDEALYYDYRANMEADPKRRLKWELKAADSLGDDPDSVCAALNIYNNLMKAFTENNKTKDALDVADRLIDLYDKYPEYCGYDYGSFLVNYGFLQMGNRNFRDALQCFEAEKQFLEEVGLEGSRDYAAALERIGAVYLMAGKNKKANQYFDEGQRIYNKTCLLHPEEAEEHRQEINKIRAVLRSPGFKLPVR